MSNLERIVRKSFKMVVRQSPAKAAEERRRLEAAQAVDRPIILASRYNFSPPLSFNLHQKHDVILQAAYPALYDFTYSTFAGYLNPLEIEPLFSDEAVFLHQALFYGTPASAMHVIGRYGMLAKVRLFLNGKSGQVFVQDKAKFVELPEWLQTLPQPAGLKTGVRGYEDLLAWWTAKGQTLNILDLPVELWTYIFELTFSMDIYPNELKKLGEGYEHINMHRNILEEVKTVSPPTTSILYLNRQIYAELQPFVAKHTCKSFPAPGDLRLYIMKSFEESVKLDNLRILELDSNLRDFIIFFGAEIALFENLQARQDFLDLYGFWREASILKHLPSLAHLYLHFPAPSDGKNDTWQNTGTFQRPRGGNGLERQRSFVLDIVPESVGGLDPDIRIRARLSHLEDYTLRLHQGQHKRQVGLRLQGSEGERRQVRRGGNVELYDSQLGQERSILTIRSGPSCHCTNFCGQVYRKPFQPKGKKKTVWRRKPFEFDYED